MLPSPEDPTVPGRGQPPAPPGDDQLPAYLQAARSPEARKALLRRGQFQVIFGMIWFVIGLGLTLWTLSWGHRFYLVAWGPMLYGVIQIVVGRATISRSNRL